MDKENIKDKIERLKLKAEFLCKENIKVFVKDIYNTYYFCNIVFVGEQRLVVVPFVGRKENESISLLWMDIENIKEYTEEKEK